MKQLLLILIFLFGIACDNTRLTINNSIANINENVHLFISPIDSSISKELKINCYLVNSNNTNISILGRFDITTIESFEYVWYAEVCYLKSGRQKMLPFALIGDLLMPTAEEYIIIKPNETKKIMFTINFDKLEDKSGTFPIEFNNTDYGKYTVKLIYKDTFCKHENALKGPIESNIIEVIYKEK